MRLHTKFALIIVAVTAALCVSYASIGFAQDVGQQGGYRIGVVDRKAVYDAYQRQIDQMSRIEQEVTQREQEIDEMLERVEGKRERYLAQRDSMPEDEALELRDEIDRDLRAVMGQREDWEREIQRRADRLISQIRAEIDQAVQEIGVEENYHLILDGDPGIPSGVLYFSSTMNMTGRVIERLNSQYQSGS